jgi:hypothetical protein
VRLPVIRTAWVIVVGVTFAITLATAEDCPYAEYRFLKPLGQIQIATGSMERAPGMASRTAELERQGILILESDVGRTFMRKERVGAHSIETRISVAPPAGHGEGGAASNVDLKVVMDGETLVDCPLSYAFGGVDRMSIDPARRFVTLNGHYGIVRFDGFESRKVIDSDWLIERARSVEALITKGPNGLR